MAIKNVTIVGGGVMGAGIAEASTIIISSYIFTFDKGFESFSNLLAFL